MSALWPEQGHRTTPPPVTPKPCSPAPGHRTALPQKQQEAMGAVCKQDARRVIQAKDGPRYGGMVCESACSTQHLYAPDICNTPFLWPQKGSWEMIRHQKCSETRTQHALSIQDGHGPRMLTDQRRSCTRDGHARGPMGWYGLEYSWEGSRVLCYRSCVLRGDADHEWREGGNSILRGLRQSEDCEVGGGEV